MDYANYSIEDLYYFLDEEEHWLTVLREGFASFQELSKQEDKINAIYNEIERRKDLYRT